MNKFLFLSLCVLFSLQFSFSQTIVPTTKSNWYPYFHNTGFNSIYIDGNIIYASSYDYGIYKSIDNGKTFVSINNFTDLMKDAYFDKVTAKDNIVFLSTHRGLLRSTDYGMTWANNWNFSNVKNLLFQDDNIYVYADNGFSISTDQGATWQQRNEGLPYWQGGKGFYMSGNNVMVGVYGDGVYYSSDKGISWELRSNGLDNKYTDEILAEGNVFYTASGDGISKTTDFGLNWTQINEGLEGGYNLLYDNGYLYVISTGSSIFRRDINGNNWEKFIGTDKTYYGISKFIIKNSKVYISTGYSFLFSDDSGNTFELADMSAFNNDSRRNINCIFDLNNKFYAGTRDGILISSDFGKSWELNYGLPNYSTINHIKFYDNCLFVATEAGVYKSTDLGSNWVQIFNKPSNFINGYNNYLYAGEKYNNEGIYRSSDNGVTWQQVNNGLTDLNIKCMTQSGNNLLAGSYTYNKGIFKSTDWGDNWFLAYEPNDNLYSLFGDGTNVFAGAWWSRHRSTDNGNTWTNLNIGGSSLDLKKINNRIYSVGINISYSEDNGYTWIEDDYSLPNFMVTTIAGKTSKLFSGTNGRAVYRQINFSGDFGSIDVGKKSDPYPYLVSGYELNENITVTVPDGFEISLSPFDGYGSSVVLEAKENLVIYQEVYIRFAPNKAKTYSSNITHESNGADAKYVAVTGIGLPVLPTVTIATTTNINASKAKSGGNVTFDGGLDITERGICYNKTGDPTVSDTKLASGTGTGAFISNFTGLRANTKYYARAYAVNSFGTAYSDEINFTTGNPEIPVLSTNAVTSITSNSAVSGGNITDDGGVDIISRGVCWNTTGNPTILDSKTFDGSAIGTFVSSLTNLNLNKKYHVRAYATNSVGESYGNEVSFITPAIEILLNKGWNLISSNILPNLSDNMESIFSSISDKVLIVKNNIGSAYIPQYKINDIGNWDITQGYMVYLSESATLGIIGTEVNPTEYQIKLNQGWNIISYLRNQELNCETAFAKIADNLVIVKDNHGNVYIPSFGINTIGNLIPGQGYMIYVTNEDILVYPGNWANLESVTIGDQVWTFKNLDVDHYKNGDPIRHAESNNDWIDAGNKKEGAWCYYNNDSELGKVYGKLYNWYTVNDTRGLAPNGYHVPSDNEWKIIEMYLGMTQTDADKIGWRGTYEGGKMKETGTTHWNSPNTGATNSSGFSGLPGGYRDDSGCYSIREYGYWWSATDPDTTSAWYRSLVNTDTKFYRNHNSYKKYAMSVRCVKD